MTTSSDQREVTAPGLPAALWRARLEARPVLEVLPVTAGQPVTVVVPHPDDESLGLGGLLPRLAAAGAELRVVIVTDGAAGYPGCTPAQADVLGRLRRAETHCALSVLGLDDVQVEFLDLPDGTATEHSSRLVESLAEFLPAGSLGLAPWPHDPHPDHQAAGRAAELVATRNGVPLWQYPIWMRHSVRPDDPRVDLDRLVTLRLTEAEQQTKRAAIEAHESQLRAPFSGFGPVLPEHVLELFADGLEPYFVTGAA